jgi:hypothetical protein
MIWSAICIGRLSASLEGEIQMADRARRRRRNKIIDGLKEALAHARGESTGIRGR